MCGSDGRRGGGADGRRGGGMTIGLKEGAVGTDGLRLPPKIPLRKTARWLTYFWADRAPQESRQGTDGEKGGRSQTGKPSEVTQSLSPRLLPFSA